MPEQAIEMNDFLGGEQQQETQTPEPSPAPAAPQPVQQPAPQAAGPQAEQAPASDQPVPLPSYLMEWADQLGVKDQAEKFTDATQLGQALAFASAQQQRSFAQQQQAAQAQPAQQPAAAEETPIFPDVDKINLDWDPQFRGMMVDIGKYVSHLEGKVKSLEETVSSDRFKSLDNLDDRIQGAVYAAKEDDRHKETIKHTLGELGYDKNLLDDPAFFSTFRNHAKALVNSAIESGQTQPDLAQVTRAVIQMMPQAQRAAQVQQTPPPRPQLRTPSPAPQPRARDEQGRFASQPARPPIGAPSHHGGPANGSHLRDLFLDAGQDPGPMPQDDVNLNDFLGAK